MPTIHPAFDCSTATWFTIEPAYEAVSLKELAMILNGRTDGPFKIEGYYPNGYQADRPIGLKTMPVMRPDLSHGAKFRLFPPTPAEHKIIPPPVKKTHGYDNILDLWAQGLGTDTIALRTGLKPKTIVSIVGKHRKRGDPRAVLRGNQRKQLVALRRDPVEKEELKAAIIQLFNDGYSYDQIAQQLHITRGVVSGHVFRAKEKQKGQTP